MEPVKLIYQIMEKADNFSLDVFYGPANKELRQFVLNSVFDDNIPLSECTFTNFRFVLTDILDINIHSKCVAAIDTDIIEAIKIEGVK